MSRGPGRWQRVLLSLLQENAYVPIIDAVKILMDGSPKRTDLVAARRAAKRLAESGRAQAVYMWRCTRCTRLLPSPPFRCPCGGRITPALVLTSRTVLMPRIPSWVSVARGEESSLATLSPARPGRWSRHWRNMSQVAAGEARLKLVWDKGGPNLCDCNP